MAIENTYLLGKNITLGCGFDLQAKAPLDSRQTVPAFEGLRALIIGDAAYEGMIVYDEGTKKTYQAQKCEAYSVEVDGKTKTYDIAFREFGINEAELKDLIASETTAAMEFKGATAALPENPAKGDMWKVTAAFEVAGETTKVGDSIVYNGEEWFRIPSGDDIEDTWRIITVGGTSLGGIAEGKALNLTAGAKLDVALTEDGDVVYSHEEIAAPTATPVGEDEQTRTYIASIETDGYGHITGYKTATENVEDTNTTYTFEGQSDEATSVYFQVTASDAEAAEVIYLDTYSKNEINEVIEAVKVESANQAAVILGEAQAYTDGKDEEVRGLIGDNAKAIEDLDKYIGTIPVDENLNPLANSVVEYVNKKTEGIATAGNLELLEGRVTGLEGRMDNAEAAINAINDTENGILKQAQDYADGLAGNYDEAGAAAGVKDELTAEINKKVDKETYEADKATFAVAETVNAALDLKANAADVVANDTFESFKTDNTQAIADAKAGAVSEVEAKGYAVATEVAETYATKTELGNVDAKFASYNTTAVQKGIDDAQDARIKAIEDDYLVEADIANFETKENVKKVADDLAAYIESNDAALAAETKARTDADAGFETRIAALESNFGDGEGTVEAQIATAVKVEEDARKEAVNGVQDEVDAVEGRMDTAEGKITALETESAKHAIKTEVEGALELKADKSVVDAMYTNAQIDGFIAEAKKYADDNDADTQYGIVYDSETKKIKLVSDTSKTEIDATDFIKDGMIETVALSEDGKNLVITWNADSDKGEDNVTSIPLSGLVDIYTGVDGTTIKVDVSSDNKIGAEVKTNSIKDGHIATDAAIAKGKLAADVQTSLGLADSAIQEGDLAPYAKTADIEDSLALADSALQEEDFADFFTNSIKLSAAGEISNELDLPIAGASVTLKSGSGDILLVTGEGKDVKVNGKALGDLAFKNETDLDLSSKQDKLSEAQLAAVNSGITAMKVGTYDNLASFVTNNQETWSKAGPAIQEVGTKAVDGGAAFTVDGNEYAWLQSTDGAKLSIGYMAATGPIPAQIIFNTSGLEAAGAAAAVQGEVDKLAEQLEDAKTEAANQDAVVLAEAQKGIDALAENVYTKSDIEELMSWGEF